METITVDELDSLRPELDQRKSCYTYVGNTVYKLQQIGSNMSCAFVTRDWQNKIMKADSYIHCVVSALNSGLEVLYTGADNDSDWINVTKHIQNEKLKKLNESGFTIKPQVFQPVPPVIDRAKLKDGMKLFRIGFGNRGIPSNSEFYIMSTDNTLAVKWSNLSMIGAISSEEVDINELLE